MTLRASMRRASPVMICAPAAKRLRLPSAGERGGTAGEHREDGTDDHIFRKGNAESVLKDFLAEQAQSPRGAATSLAQMIRVYIR
jgi:hypothetical protein